jgi:3-keto-disaccharide hydrolase
MIPLFILAAASAIVPQSDIVLFNGKDLTPFYTWIAGSGREDPDHVFTVVDQIDGAPALRSSGQHTGGLVTRERYANYHLEAEYRWGPVTWAPRKALTRDAGILLHCQGEDGNYTADFAGPWMRSVELQFIEGGTGDIILVGGHERDSKDLFVPTLKATVTPGTHHWNPAGVLESFGKGKNRVDCVYKDTEWKDFTGFRGRHDVERPVGEWNKVEAICDGGNVTFILNGVKVNEGRDGSYLDGKILIQSEGAEIYFRKIVLHPLHP